MAPLKYTLVSRRVVRLDDDAAPPPAPGCVSASASAACAQAVPLSPLDAFPFVRGMSVSMAYVYRGSLEADALAASLRAVLRRFPIVAGRVRRVADVAAHPLRAELEVALTGAGVTLDVFDCDGSVADFDAFADPAVAGLHTCPRAVGRPPKICAGIAPFDDLLAGAPLARYRLTRLRCGGCVLGASFAHILGDAASALAFAEAWAAEHAALAAGAPKAAAPRFGEPVFDRRVLFAATEAPPLEELPPSTAANTAVARARLAALGVRVTFRRLLGRAVKAVRDGHRAPGFFCVTLPAALVASARAAAPGCSANDVALGFGWALLRRVRSRGKAGDAAKTLLGGEEHLLMQTADLRRYLPGLPASYFGNACWGALLGSPTGADARSPLALARACRTRMTEFTDSVALFDQLAPVMHPPQTFTAVLDALRLTCVPAFCDGVFSSINHPPIWQVQFGAGLPVWTHHCIVPATPWGMALLPARPGAGAPGDLLLTGTCPRASLPALRKEAAAVLALLQAEATAAATAAEAPPAEAASP
jgi:hypothetical protein